MTARDVKRIIGKAAGEKYALDQDALGTKVISVLKAAGYSIVHESEIHGPTRERCAIAANGEDDVVLAVEAIRALPDGGVSAGTPKATE